MQDLGYESHNSIIILGALGLMAVFWILKVLFYFVIMIPYVLIRKKGVQFANSLKK